jgi:hypothetical protein
MWQRSQETVGRCCGIGAHESWIFMLRHRKQETWLRPVVSVLADRERKMGGCTYVSSATMPLTPGFFWRNWRSNLDQGGNHSCVAVGPQRPILACRFHHSSVGPGRKILGSCLCLRTWSRHLNERPQTEGRASEYFPRRGRGRRQGCDVRQHDEIPPHQAVQLEPQGSLKCVPKTSPFNLQDGSARRSGRVQVLLLGQCGVPLRFRA